MDGGRGGLDISLYVEETLDMNSFMQEMRFP